MRCGKLGDLEVTSEHEHVCEAVGQGHLEGHNNDRPLYSLHRSPQILLLLLASLRVATTTDVTRAKLLAEQEEEPKKVELVVTAEEEELERVEVGGYGEGKDEEVRLEGECGGFESLEVENGEVEAEGWTMGRWKRRREMEKVRAWVWQWLRRRAWNWPHKLHSVSGRGGCDRYLDHGGSRTNNRSAV
jgi:hypothetical protein